MKHVTIKGGNKLQSFVKPMLATPTDRPPFDHPDWVFEIKWDGYRAVAEIDKKNIRFYSRNGLTFDKAYPKVYEALRTIKTSCTIDGEVVVFDKQGRPSFQLMQNYDSRSAVPIKYYVFDCLQIDGKDITGRPLRERKQLLQKLLPESSVIRYCDHVEGEGIAFYQQVEKSNLEGMIAKMGKSVYVRGKRSSDWLKIKNVKAEEVIIVGFTEPKGTRQYFGSLLLAVYDKRKLTYVGNVGTGFTDRLLKELHAKFSKHIRKKSPLDVPIKETPDITWIEPVFVCNVAFTEITGDGLIRHPVFQGLRVDKSPKEVMGLDGGKVRRKS
jgi:bifunctional non-homologous end joining protein LigD